MAAHWRSRLRFVHSANKPLPGQTDGRIVLRERAFQNTENSYNLALESGGLLKHQGQKRGAIQPVKPLTQSVMENPQRNLDYRQRDWSILDPAAQPRPSIDAARKLT